MSKTTTLGNGQITTTDALRVELREPDEWPATISSSLKCLQWSIHACSAQQQAQSTADSYGHQRSRPAITFVCRSPSFGAPIDARCSTR